MPKLRRSGKDNIFINAQPALQDKRVEDEPENDFQKCLRNVGFIIGKRNDANELNVDQAVFVKDLTKECKESPSTIDTFISGFEQHLEDEGRLKWCLMPTVTAAACKTARNVCQDSLVHLLLNIEVIQEKISKLLFEKLVELSVASNHVFDNSDGKSSAYMIISQFRWLSKLVNSKELAEQLVELIKATPVEVQKDIIVLLPDIVDESDHPRVASSLSEILLDSQELNVTILGTLTNLNIEEDTLSKIREQILNNLLPTVNIEDLPVVVKFVLLNLTSNEISDTIHKLRNNLDFSSTFNPVLASTPIEEVNATKSIESHVLNSIKLTLKFQKPLCDGWIKYIQSLKSFENHKPLDILILLVIYSLDTNVQKIKSVIKNKVQLGDMNEDLLQTTFRYHHAILNEYSVILLKLAEILLRSSEAVVSQFGCSIYEKCFIWFDTFSKQEVVASLITHVGNKSKNETNAAINTLINLVHHHTLKMVPFGLFVKKLLDHFDDLTLNQIRKVYILLSILSYHCGREGEMLQNDIMIIIRKQLTSVNLRYKKMGVIGALIAAKISVSKDENDTVDSPESLDVVDLESNVQHSISLLELVVKSTSDSWEAFSLFCDELSRIINDKKFGKQITNWIVMNVLADFEDIYIVDVKSDSNFGLGVAAKFGLDKINEPIALNLHTIVQKDFKRSETTGRNFPVASSQSLAKKQHDGDCSKILAALLKLTTQCPIAGSSSKETPSKSMASVKLPSMFRLLRILKHTETGNLAEIDAVLGCSIMLPEIRVSNFSALSIPEKHHLLNVLFICINWIRENINAFVTAEDEDIKQNVTARLQLLVELNELVGKYIQDAPNYMPPCANFDYEEQDMGPIKIPSKKGTKRKTSSKGSKSKKAKITDTQQCTISLHQNRGTSIANPKYNDADSDGEDINKQLNVDSHILNLLQPYFREFDIQVFLLLELGITFEKSINIFSLDSVGILPSKLHPKEMKFLLDDLSAKLHYSLSNSRLDTLRLTIQKQMRFSNLELIMPHKLITFCIEYLLSPMCNILEGCCEYFKTINQSNDGIEDPLILLSDDVHLISKCMQLIFKIFHQILSWKNLDLAKNIVLLKSIIHIFSSKVKTLPEHAGVEDLAKLSISYFIQYADALPNLSLAAGLLDLMMVLLKYNKDTETKVKVSDMAHSFLKKKWIDFSIYNKNAENNESIKITLTVYLAHSECILKSLECLATDAIPQMLNEEHIALYPTLNKLSLGCYYKVMLSNLANYVKKSFSKSLDDNDAFINWSIAVKIFHILTNLIKTFEARGNIRACLMFGRQFIDTFLKFGMPLLDRLFATNKEDVICLLKALQMSTRYMQHICSHSKVLKDVALTKQVPFLKKSLESFVFRVKVMLAVNKCADAFWLGNLKNRNIKGVEILSQAQEENDSEEEEEQNVELEKSSEDEEEENE